ncbi:MAG: hypothetical protein HYT71_03935 [Candidatus Aenigmarchaeota archaeon]|nr:hypothetical protein [Candidatus Aenigmarchaeota archaeon]
MLLSSERDLGFFVFRGLHSISGPLQLVRGGETYRIRKVLGYRGIRADVRSNLPAVIEYRVESGFSGQGYDGLESRTRRFLDAWHQRYRNASSHSNKDAQEDAEYSALASGFLYSGILGSSVAVPLDMVANARDNAVADGITRFAVATGEFVSYAVPFITRRDKASASRALEFIKDSGIGLFAGPAMQIAGYFAGLNDVDWYRGLTVSMYSNGNNWAAITGRFARDIRHEGLVKGVKTYFNDAFPVANLAVMAGDTLWGGVIRPGIGFETTSNTAAMGESMILSSDCTRAAGLAMVIKRIADRKLNTLVSRKFLDKLYADTE